MTTAKKRIRFLNISVQRYWSFRARCTIIVSLYEHMPFTGENTVHICTRHHSCFTGALPVCENTLGRERGTRFNFDKLY